MNLHYGLTLAGGCALVHLDQARSLMLTHSVFSCLILTNGSFPFFGLSTLVVVAFGGL